MKAQNQDFETLLSGLPPIRSLTPAAEQTLARSKRQSDKTELVLAHMREAFYYVRQCCRARIEDREIYSLCYKALSESVKGFSPDKQRFFAYAKPNLRGNISRYWKQLDVVRNSSVHETEPRPDFIIPPHLPTVDETPVLVNPHEFPPETDFVEPDFKSMEMRERMARLLPVMNKKLSVQEKMIFELHYIGGYNFEEIGKLLEPRVSRSAVQQTHARALKKLQGEMRRAQTLFSR